MNMNIVPRKGSNETNTKKMKTIKAMTKSKENTKTNANAKGKSKVKSTIEYDTIQKQYQTLFRNLQSFASANLDPDPRGRYLTFRVEFRQESVSVGDCTGVGTGAGRGKDRGSRGNIRSGISAGKRMGVDRCEIRIPRALDPLDVINRYADAGAGADFHSDSSAAVPLPVPSKSMMCQHMEIMVQTPLGHIVEEHCTGIGVKLIAFNPDYGDFGCGSAGTRTSTGADECTRTCSEHRNLDGNCTGTSQSGADVDVDVDIDGVDVSDDANANANQLHATYERERLIYQLQQSKIGDASTIVTKKDVDADTASRHEYDKSPQTRGRKRSRCASPQYMDGNMSARPFQSISCNVDAWTNSDSNDSEEDVNEMRLGSNFEVELSFPDSLSLYNTTEINTGCSYTGTVSGQSRATKRSKANLDADNDIYNTCTSSKISSSIFASGGEVEGAREVQLESSFDEVGSSFSESMPSQLQLRSQPQSSISKSDSQSISVQNVFDNGSQAYAIPFTKKKQDLPQSSQSQFRKRFIPCDIIGHRLKNNYTDTSTSSLQYKVRFYDDALVHARMKKQWLDWSKVIAKHEVEEYVLDELQTLAENTSNIKSLGFYCIVNEIFDSIPVQRASIEHIVNKKGLNWMDHLSEEIAYEDERSSVYGSCSSRPSQVLLSKGISSTCTHEHNQVTNINTSQGSCDVCSATDVNTITSASLAKSNESVHSYKLQEPRQLYQLYSLRNPITIVNM